MIFLSNILHTTQCNNNNNLFHSIERQNINKKVLFHRFIDRGHVHTNTSHLKIYSSHFKLCKISFLGVKVLKSILRVIKKSSSEFKANAIRVNDTF